MYSNFYFPGCGRIGGGCHLKLVLVSDLFTPNGRTTLQVVWELTVIWIDQNSCEFTNHVYTYSTGHLLDLVSHQGIPFELFKAQRVPISKAHNEQETPFFATSIERAALRNK
jgi:hypothetical protein